MQEMREDQQNNLIVEQIQNLEAEVDRLLQENHQLRQALETARASLTRLQGQIEREHLIEEVAIRIRQSLSLENILQIAVAEVRKFLGVDRAIIYRFKPDWSGGVTIESAAPDIPPILYSTFEEPCFRAGYVTQYQAGRLRAINDIYAEDLADCYRDLLEAYQVRANLVIPVLQGDDTLWGLLIAHQCRTSHHWNWEDIRLLLQLATQLGVAIKQAELCDRLRLQATTDELTQLANRRRFDDYLQTVWAQSQRQQTPIALIMVDIDFFKHYNDCYGHPAGDVCLTAVSKVLSDTIKRSVDLAARYGGEEFMIILPDTNIAGALAVASKIQSAIAALNLPHQDSPFAQVTLSLGVASHIPKWGETPACLIAAVDRALYRAKASGRNRVDWGEA